MAKKLSLLFMTILLATCIPAAADASLRLVPPVGGTVAKGFDDVERFAAGHRGVDLKGSSGETVLAAADGRVHFAGTVAGRGTVSIDHGNGWRTTYQPVTPLVRRGQEVRAGERIAILVPGHCSPTPCLHWGLTDGTDYLNPFDFLTDMRVRLLPRGAQPVAPPTLSPARVPIAEGKLPVEGRVTSRYGMRTHPITGVRKLHDGLDIAAPCGTTITAPRAGVVTRTEYSRGYGWRVTLDHGGGLVTAYAHLPGVGVSVGTKLSAGDRVGTVGNTGWSTGCHLHWMGWRHGTLVDPLALVS